MRTMPIASTPIGSLIARGLLPAAAFLSLAGCGSPEEETTLTTDAEDLSGGEFIINEEDPDAVPVDTPDTPMTNVPPVEATDSAGAPEAPAT